MLRRTHLARASIAAVAAALLVPAGLAPPAGATVTVAPLVSGCPTPGQVVPFQASLAPDPAIAGGSLATRVQWDFNGDGTFETETPSLAASFAYPGLGTFVAAARVTRADGTVEDSHPQTGLVAVRLAPPAGPVGVSIDGGAQYTDTPDVTLSVVWPGCTSDITLANDGGFGRAQTVPITTAIAWKLDSSGAERLPKTIYARFRNLRGGADLGFGPSPTQTFQDDIILDERAPAAQPAESDGLATGAAVPVRTLRVASTGAAATITATPAGLDGRIACVSADSGSPCAASFRDGTAVDLRLDPDEAAAALAAGPGVTYTWQAPVWTGCDTVTDLVCHLTVRSDRDVHVSLGKTVSARATSHPGARAAAARPRLARPYRVLVRARDANSGVATVQVSATRRGGARIAIATGSRRGATSLTRTVRAWLTAPPRYVRVRDAAGNWSRWVPVHRPR